MVITTETCIVFTLTEAKAKEVFDADAAIKTSYLAYDAAQLYDEIHALWSEIHQIG